ncbi:hypothetical protein ANN_21650 [Periplaneta americana]|uniref:Uncharacterized protein n=1 Tax=Periplaneta americana TaxID=6978 RepID=A0ABQ8S6I7_PERAM|nr:hypothetical protein ANN_21650 [Periplaneta americana]
MMLKLDRMRKRNSLGHRLRRNCLLKDALEGLVNGRKVRSRRKYHMIDDIVHTCGVTNSWRDLILPKSQNEGKIYSLVCLRITDADSGDEDCKDFDRAQLQAVAELVTELLDIVQPYNEEGGTDIRKDSDLISNEINNFPPPTHRIKRERNKGDNAGGKCPGSSTDSDPAFAHIGLREKPGKNLNQYKVFYTSYNGWGDHRVNHTIPPFWLDDRPPLLRHVGVRPAAGCSVSTDIVGLCKYCLIPLPWSSENYYQMQNCPYPQRFLFSDKSLYLDKASFAFDSLNALQMLEEEKELAVKKLPTEEFTGRNGEREKSSGQKKISDVR